MRLGSSVCLRNNSKCKRRENNELVCALFNFGRIFPRTAYATYVCTFLTLLHLAQHGDRLLTYSFGSPFRFILLTFDQQQKNASMWSNFNYQTEYVSGQPYELVYQWHLIGYAQRNGRMIHNTRTNTRTNAAYKLQRSKLNHLISVVSPFY